MELTVRPRLRRLLAYAAGAVALVVLVLALLPGHGPSSTASLDHRTQDVAGRLRCPTCVAESAADSTSPVAESMRSEIRRQLAAGRSEDQVVAWFRTRYGSDIVLDPQRQGLGWVLWAAPPLAGLAVVAGVAGVVVVRRRRTGDPQRQGEQPDRPDSTDSTAPAPSALPVGRLAVVLAVTVAAAVAVPLLVRHGSADQASADQASADQATAEQSASGSSGSSGSASASPSAGSASASGGSADPVATAFALLRAGHAGAAETLVRPVSRRAGPDRAMALLVLGLAQRAEGEPAAARTLRSFVDRYPHHPAAAEVRRLLAAS